MDNFLEILVPIIFALVYLFAGAGKKKEGESKEEEPARELTDRERDIQEEIRRKIMERAQGKSAPGAPPASTPQADRGSGYDPTVPEQPRRRPTPVKRFEEAVKPTPPPQPQQRSFAPEPESERDALETPALQRQFEDRERQIRDIQEKAERLRRQADQDLRKVKSMPARKPTPVTAERLVQGDSFRDRFIFSLKDKEAFKRSILAYEVLGTPVGERKQGKIGPFWEQ